MRTSWRPDDDDSIGLSVYAPFEVTVAWLLGPHQPYWPLWKLFIWQAQMFPIVSKGSPYSLAVQLVEMGTRCPFAVQLNELAWWTPRLWPSSCAATRVMKLPLMNDWLPGR